MNFQYRMSTKWVFAPILRLIHEIIIFLIILSYKIIYITFYIIRRNSKIEYFYTLIYFKYFYLGFHTCTAIMYEIISLSLGK